MKTLLSALVVLALVCPAYADSVLLSEDFDGNGGTAPAVGTPLTSLGWTANSNMVVSSAVIGVGQSADWTDGNPAWPKATKGFSRTPAAGEVYTVTATLYAPNTTGADSELWICNSSGGPNNALGAAIDYGNLEFGVPNVQRYFAVTPQPLVPMDVKMVLQGTTGDFYYRTHGVSDWTYVGQKTDIPWSISVYDQLTIATHGGVVGGIDSIMLSTSATVPEPTSLALFVTGLLGLLAYAWRRRR